MNTQISIQNTILRKRFLFRVNANKRTNIRIVFNKEKLKRKSTNKRIVLKFFYTDTQM